MEAIKPVIERRRVLAIAHRFSLGFGGVPESLLLLARELSKLGIQSDILSKDGMLIDAGKLTGLPPPGEPPSLAELAGLSVAGYACVFIAGAWNRVGWWFAARARLNGVRVVYTPKGNLARAEFKRLRDVKKFPYLVTMELCLLALSDRIIFSSELERKNSLLSSLFRDKSTILPEPFVGPALPPSTGRRPGPLRFGFMAEVAPRKGLVTLVRAFIEWQRQGSPEAHLHVVGQPRPGSEQYYSEVQKIAASAPRPESIVFRGALRGAEREHFYEEVDFFVCPTQFESFGLTPLEALWHGKPIMVTNRMGVLEFISDPNSTISLGEGSVEETLAAFGAAMTGHTGYSASALHWRMQPCERLSGERLALQFARELSIIRTV